MRQDIYWSLTGVTAALLMSFVAPAMYGARAIRQGDEAPLGHPTGGAARATERMGDALFEGRAPPSPPVIVDAQPRRGDVRSQPRPRARVEPLLGVGVDLTTQMAGGEDPGAVLPPYERDIDASSPRHHRPTALSEVTGVLLGPRAATGLSTLQHSVLGGPEPGERSLPRTVQVHPRFGRGGMQCEVSWAF